MTLDDEFFEQLRGSNPHRDSGDSPQPELSKRARFEEITMQPFDTPTESAGQRNPAIPPAPWWRRPMVAGPSLAGMVAVIVAAAMVFSAATASSALALVTEATENAAQFDSGTALLTIEFREGDELEEPGVIAIDYAYEGDNYRMLQDMSALGGEFSEAGAFNTIGVDGTTYLQTDLSGTFFALPDDGGFSDAWGGVVPSTEALTPQSIAALLDVATDVSEETSNDSTTVYIATIRSSAIRAMDSSDLPFGLSLMAQTDGDDLPEFLDLTLRVEGDLLHEIVVDIVGESEDGFVDAVMTTTFSDFGVPQDIEAPPADQVTTEPRFSDLPVTEDDAILELEQRRPGLCDEAFSSVPAEDFSDEAFANAGEEYVKCLIAEGETAAAEQFAEVTGVMESLEG